MNPAESVRIADCTLVGTEDEVLLSFREKIECCKILDRLNVSVIQLNPIRQKKIDSLLIKSICTAVKNAVIAVPVNLSELNTEEIWETMKSAPAARLQVTVPVSSVQMEYLFHKKPQAVLKAMSEGIASCRKQTDNVELIAEDATRSDHAFLCDLIREAIARGASTVTLSDTAGNMLPDEIGAFVDRLYADVPELKDVTLGFSASNTMFLADACAVAAIRHGAREIKTVSSRNDFVSLPHICRVIRTKGSEFHVNTDVHMEQINRVIHQLDMLFSRQRTGARLQEGEDQADTDMLHADDSRQTVMLAVQKLGYDLNPEDQEKVWNSFLGLAAKKPVVSPRELDAIIAAEAMQVPAAYANIQYAIHTDHSLGAMARMRMRFHQEELEGVSAGNGAVDAAFMAIEKAIGRHFELDDFQIQAITEGQEAMGETIVRLRNEGKLYSGRGLSTDIIGASIMAYMNALNKIVFEEEEA